MKKASGLIWPIDWKNLQRNIVSWIFNVTSMQESLHIFYKQKWLKGITIFSRVSRTTLIHRPHFSVIDYNYNLEHSCTKLLVLLLCIGFDSWVYLNLFSDHWFPMYTLHGTGFFLPFQLSDKLVVTVFYQCHLLHGKPVGDHEKFQLSYVLCASGERKLIVGEWLLYVSHCAQYFILLMTLNFILLKNGIFISGI